MEILLKPHNQIELPQDLCRKLELTPGIRLEIEVDGATGAIILHPITKQTRQPCHHSRTKQVRKIKSASRG